MYNTTITGSDWAVCSTNTRGKVRVGNWCPNTNSLHGHSGSSTHFSVNSLVCSLRLGTWDWNSIKLPYGIIFDFFCFQDIARLTFIALRNEKINKKLLTFAGPRAWTTQEVDFFFVAFLLLLCHKLLDHGCCKFKMHHLIFHCWCMKKCKGGSVAKLKLFP